MWSRVLVVESIASIPGETRLEDRFFSLLLRFTRQAGAEDELHLDRARSRGTWLPPEATLRLKYRYLRLGISQETGQSHSQDFCRREQSFALEY